MCWEKFAKGAAAKGGDLNMSKEEIRIGVEMARKALQFAFFSNGKVTYGDCRKAILILFGEEVDSALADEFSPKVPPNAS